MDALTPANSNRLSLLRAFFLTACCAAPPLHAQQQREELAPAQRVIVLAFDGLGLDLVRAAVSSDPPRMPFLAQLSARGTRARLLSTVPMSLPSTWTSLITGRSPEAHRILGYVDLDPGSGEEPRPRLGFDAERSGFPTFFELAAAAGVRTTTVKVPRPFAPREQRELRSLAGFPIRDARNSLGDWFVLDGALDEASQTGTAGTLLPLRPVDQGNEVVWEARLEGPLDSAWNAHCRQRLHEAREQLQEIRARKPRGYREAVERNQEIEAAQSELTRWNTMQQTCRASVPVAIRVLNEPRQRGAWVRIGGSQQWLKAGEWSAAPFAFELRSPLDPWPFPSGLRARCSVKLLRAALPQLFVGPLQLDLERPPLRRSPAEPRSFGAKLGALGLPSSPDLLNATAFALKDGAIDEATVLEALERSLVEQRRALLDWLASDHTSRLFVWCFPDPAQFLPVWQWRLGAADERRWRFLGIERSASEVLDAFCAELDAIAAEVHRTHVEGRDGVELVVLSPYGCRPCPRLFDPSTWLARRGYLDVDLAQVAGWLDANSRSCELSGFDCLRLRQDTSTAFALGLGTIQLDPRLSEGDRERLADELASALMAERDPEGRAPVQAIHRFTRRDDSGRTWLELRLAFSESWRTEPSATLGGLRFERRAGDEIAFASPFSRNATAYASDYDSSAPEGAPGFFFSTHLYRLDTVEPQLFRQPWKGSVPEIHSDLPKLSVLHLAPTLLRRLGLEPTSNFDAAPLGDRAH